MLTEKEVERLKEWSKSFFNNCEQDWMLFDSHAEIDRSLTIEENKTIMREKIKVFLETNKDNSLTKKQVNELELKPIGEEEAKEMQLSYRDKYFLEHNILKKENLEKVRTIAVYGSCGSGKTALCYKIISLYSDKPVYFIKHPKPYLLKKFGYKNINSIEEIQRLQDCVIYFDEPQLSTNIQDKKSNRIIAKICSLARQRNITLIISSSDTRVFTKHNESYFDLWLVKDIDYSMVKERSIIWKMIRNNSILEPEGFRLLINEFIAESRNLYEFNGKHTFGLVKNWDEELSTPYRI